MVIYRSFFARLAKCSAQAQYEQFKRAGGANRRGSLGDLESETRKLLGGVTYELQQALAAKVQQMGGEEAMRVAFEKFDENGDGQISPEELKTGLQALDIRGANGKRISDDEIDKLCVVLDQDDDGCISYEEFVAQFGAAPRQSAREALGTMSKELQDVIRKNKTNLRKIFHAFDEDGDGSISAQELRLGLRALNLDVSAIQVKDMINLLDANGDGSIDWNEFQAVFGGENVVAKGISRSYRRVLVSLIPSFRLIEKPAPPPSQRLHSTSTAQPARCLPLPALTWWHAMLCCALLCHGVAVWCGWCRNRVNGLHLSILRS
jgi:Ca2+-binding EF-hand superfamily protein